MVKVLLQLIYTNKKILLFYMLQLVHWAAIHCFFLLRTPILTHYNIEIRSGNNPTVASEFPSAKKNLTSLTLIKS
jgi:hypothetical protein